MGHEGAPPPAPGAGPRAGTWGVEPPADAPVSGRLVRPYVLTQGRTRSVGAHLLLDARVRATVTPAGLDPDVTPEARRIVELCQEPVPIAELAARLRLPVGVVRVLVGDLQAAAAVAVDAAAPPDAGTDVNLLERLLDGIRAL